MKKLSKIIFGFILLLFIGGTVCFSAILERTEVNGRIMLSERFVLLEDVPKKLDKNFSLEEIRSLLDGAVKKLSLTETKRRHSSVMFFYQPVAVSTEFFYDNDVVMPKIIKESYGDKLIVDKKLILVELFLILLIMRFFIKNGHDLSSKSLWAFIVLLLVVFPILLSFMTINTSLAEDLGGGLFVFCFLFLVIKELRLMLVYLFILAVGFYGFGEHSVDSKVLCGVFFVQHIFLQFFVILMTIRAVRRLNGEDNLSSVNA